jgi:uncharacterized protein with PIN domain
MKFIADNNVGKLARWLRMMGYDTRFFKDKDDWEMVRIALNEERVILTRDTEIMRRGAIVSGRIKAVFIKSDISSEQIRQVVETLSLDYEYKPFSICLECNEPLESREKGEVEGRVPPYVFRTQDKYMECPSCHRIYWKGTHWQAMTDKMNNLIRS